MRVARRDERGWCVLAVRGVVDVASAPELRQVLQEVQFGGDRRVLVDLREVELIDSFGLGVLVGARKRAVAQGGELAVAVSNDRVRHVFEVTGLAAPLGLVAEPAEILDA